MCAKNVRHATIGALWLLYRQRQLSGDTVHIATKSGRVTGFVSRGLDGEPLIEITQPRTAKNCALNGK